MKKTIITIVITLIVGLALGYVISQQFGKNEKSATQEHQHSETEDHQWTCSMHPQIERDEPGQCPICGMDLIPIAIGMENSKPKKGEMQDEMWTCSMHPQIQRDEPGQCPICGMDLIPMEHKKQSDKYVFEMSEEALKLAEIQTIKIGNSSINTKSNSANGISLTGKIQADETKIASVVSHIGGRVEKLYISFTGESIYAGQKIADIYSPNLITAQKELLEAYKVKEENPRLFEATRNKLKFLKVTESQINKIISSNSIQENFAIYSDYSGVVTERKVSVGDHIMEGSVLFKTQNLNKLWVLFDVYEKDLTKIKKGDKISFTTNASKKEYTTKVSFIDPVINPNTRTASVRGIIYNKNKTLKPEMFVTGEIFSQVKGKSKKLKGNREKPIIVPKSAVMWTGERSVVYIKVPNTEIPSFDYREVKLGNARGNNYEILEGLEQGEEIVVNGAFVIDASIQLKNQQSMMNPKADGKEMKGMSGHNH